jgi:uncharacterized cupin superfamily protein
LDYGESVMGIKRLMLEAGELSYVLRPRSGETKSKDLRRVFATTTVEGDAPFLPSIKARDGGCSFWRPVDVDNVVTGVWQAELGSYEHSGHVDRIETFMVIEGRGVIEIKGHTRSAIAVGSIVVIPANTPSVLTVLEPFRKFAVLSRSA